jgi:hypothetical protein
MLRRRQQRPNGPDEQNRTDGDAQKCRDRRAPNDDRAYRQAVQAAASPPLGALGEVELGDGVGESDDAALDSAGFSGGFSAGFSALFAALEDGRESVT